MNDGPVCILCLEIWRNKVCDDLNGGKFMLLKIFQKDPKALKASETKFEDG